MSALTHAGQPAPAASRSRERGGARLADLAWLTWRQHRTVIIAGLAIAAAVTGSMLYVAARITAISPECGNAACPDGSAQGALLGGSFGLATLSSYLILAVMLLPLLAGMFLGVPLLAREHEQRTLLLAWSQDITPQRWLWTKLAVLGAMTAAAGAAVSAAAGHLAARREHRDRAEPVLRQRLPGHRHAPAGTERGVAGRRRGPGRRVPPHPARHIHRAHRIRSRLPPR